MAKRTSAIFLIKSEPSVYSWSQLLLDGKTSWGGVRNYEARNNLRAMKTGDLCLYYHSNEGKEIVGVARVVRPAYPDGDWSTVDIEPAFPLNVTVSLQTLRTAAGLESVHVVTKPRISVVGITSAEFAIILNLAKTVFH
jgi:predicted RNA-binding protein with PUA-like domain